METNKETAKKQVSFAKISPDTPDENENVPINAESEGNFGYTWRDFLTPCRIYNMYKEVIMTNNLISYKSQSLEKYKAKDDTSQPFLEKLKKLII